MKNSMKDHLKERFKTSFTQLYEHNYFKNKKSFAQSLDITPQFLSQLLNDSTPVPLEFIAKYIETYPVNPSYLFTKSEGQIFKMNAPHIINQGLNQTNLNYIERPSAMSQKNYSGKEKSINLPLNLETSTDKESITELAGLFYKMSQTHLEIAKVFERMFQQATKLK